MINANVPPETITEKGMLMSRRVCTAEYRPTTKPNIPPTIAPIIAPFIALFLALPIVLRKRLHFFCLAVSVYGLSIRSVKRACSRYVSYSSCAPLGVVCDRFRKPNQDLLAGGLGDALSITKLYIRNHKRVIASEAVGLYNIFMSLRAVCEVLLYFESFKNWDLNDQGVYLVKARLEKDPKHVRECD